MNQFHSWLQLSARTWALLCIGITIAFLFSALSMRAYIVQERLAAGRLTRAQHAIAFSLWRYGIVESVRASDTSFVVVVSQDFTTAGETRNIRVFTEKDTSIGTQTLIGENGTYHTLSPVVPTTFDTLKPGSRVALLLDNRVEEEKIVARLILVGDPL